jgi:DNA-directed RNA polymerase subunit E'
MFYKVKITDHIRVPPDAFTSTKEEAILKRIKSDYDGYISAQIGFVIDVLSVGDVQEGTIVPGDGAAYYETTFELLTFRPEMQEVLPAKVRDIAEFGAFMTIGPADGMIHISQTMDDYVSFSKEKVLTGKDSNRTLRVNDKCRARVVAVSYKDLANPKIGLTMRQEGLGRIDWLEEKAEKKAEKSE